MKEDFFKTIDFEMKMLMLVYYEGYGKSLEVVVNYLWGEIDNDYFNSESLK